jgi:hypothetical protein
MACTLACAKILKDMGVLDFDLDKLHDFAMNAVRAVFEETREYTALPVMEVMSRMIADFTPMIISTPTFYVGENEEMYRVSMQHGVVGRAIRGNELKHDEFNGKLYLSVKAITDWCGEHRIDRRVLLIGLKNAGVLLNNEARATLGRDTTAVTSRCRCWELDLTKLEGDIENGTEEEDS